MTEGPREGRRGHVSPSKAELTKAHYNSLGAGEGLGPGALAIVPASRKLVCDKLILAAFIFDFLSELHRTIKRYPNRED